MTIRNIDNGNQWVLEETQLDCFTESPYAIDNGLLQVSATTLHALSVYVAGVQL